MAEREVVRAKTGYGGDWTPAHMDAVLRTGTARRGLWLDTSAQSPAETVDAIVAGMGEALVT
ncbi:hypothetical protein [Fodinicola feengrottensis]|uniref:Uncharacterized protein n=1 Tax=Fodinicola feengrottensis TaxID=435914 RepID=A0ABN2IRC5_9ACTN|nr:hypothetical protein [Fodinicola feengrottensis]